MKFKRACATNSHLIFTKLPTAIPTKDVRLYSTESDAPIQLPKLHEMGKKHIHTIILNTLPPTPPTNLQNNNLPPSTQSKCTQTFQHIHKPHIQNSPRTKITISLWCTSSLPSSQSNLTTYLIERKFANVHC